MGFGTVGDCQCHCASRGGRESNGSLSSTLMAEVSALMHTQRLTDVLWCLGATQVSDQRGSLLSRGGPLAAVDVPEVVLVEVAETSGELRSQVSRLVGVSVAARLLLAIGDLRRTYWRALVTHHVYACRVSAMSEAGLHSPLPVTTQTATHLSIS